MSKQEPEIYLQDIFDSISKIERFTANVPYEVFVKDEEKMDAVIRNLEIIGEAANNVPTEIKEKYPQVLWEKMVSTRNKVLHEYFGVDIEILWKTVQEDLPILKKQFENIAEIKKGFI